jgi:penicillin-binding protein 1A
MRRFLLWSAGGLLALGVVGLFAVWWLVLRDLPDVESLADYKPALTSRVLDRHGAPIGEFFEERRMLTPLDEVPEIVVQAFLAAEDDTFFEHRGVDYVSLLRAGIAVVMAGGEKVQGGSTITQQMVKQLLLSPEKSYTRKIREMVLAQQVEARFSKDEILFLYLNHIYFGSGAYGIGEASRTYFGKTVGEIDAGEAAMLGGLPKAPARNSPYQDPEEAEKRRRYVLSRMLEEGFIDAAAHEDAVVSLPELVGEGTDPYADSGYVTEEVRRRLVELIGNDLVLHGGLTIETTIDLELQREAVRSIQQGIEALDHRRGFRGPLRTVDAAGIEAELAELSRANGTDNDDLRADLGAEPRQGLVLSVDDKAESARIAFGAGVEADLPFETTAWAHAADDDRLHGRDVDAMSDVFQVGDVALFRLAQVDAEPEGETVLAASLYQVPDAQGGLLSFELDTGDVVAMVGGYDFARSEFNRTIQARRQPGSAFKPIVYAAALANGFTPATILHDRPVVYEDLASGFVFKPENYGRQFLGPLTMTEALARSVNNAAIHLLSEVGVDRVMEFAGTLGIHSPLERVLGLALGVSPVTLLELTRAYGILGANGRFVEPRLIARVLDRDGRVILENVSLDPIAPAPVPLIEGSETEATLADAEPEPSTLEAAEPAPLEITFSDDEEALDDDAALRRAPLPEGFVVQPADAFLAASLLRAVVEHPRGTGRRALRLGRPVGGKTGTTNDNTDAWFVGFSPELATGVWVGMDAEALLGRRETGGKAAAPIWVDFMEAALEGRPDRDFDVPDEIVFARIDAKTGKLASPASTSTLFQAFLSGTEPEPSVGGPDIGGTSDRRLRLDF